MMTPKKIMQNFFSYLANHNYTTAADFQAHALDDAVRAVSKFQSAEEVTTALQAAQIAAEREAVEEILGSSFTGKTLSQLPVNVLTSAVIEQIEDRKSDIFLKKYCLIRLDNADTGSITGSDTNIILTVGDDINGRILTTADLAALKKKYGDASTLSADGKTFTLINGVEKTDRSIVLEEFVNAYQAMTSAPQIIITNQRDWVVQATAGADTITANGADSINAGRGDDNILVNGDGTTVTSGAGSDNITISAGVNDVTITDFTAADILTISGYFEPGSATIEDMQLVISDKNGTRKIRFSDFNKALSSTVKVGTKATTIKKFLTNAGIDPNNLPRTTYAQSVGLNSSNSVQSSEVPTEISTSDGTVDADPDYKPTPAAKTDTASHSAQDITSDSSATGPITVNLSKVDTSQAGTVIINNQTVGTLSSTFPNATTFTRQGLTIHLLGELPAEAVRQNVELNRSANHPEDINRKIQLKLLTLEDLTDDQLTIISGIFRWWGSECLKLNEESVGLSFNSDTAMVKDLGIYFYDDQHSSNVLASVWNWQRVSSDGQTTKLMLAINTRYYHDIAITDVDGESPSTSALLDRTLAHELNHAILAANIKYFQKLPTYIKEGTAEVIHGIDDMRRSTIIRAAKNNEYRAAGLDDDSDSGSAYANGYMWDRFFVRQAVLQTIADDLDEVYSAPKLISLSDAADAYLNTETGVTVAGNGGNDTINNNASNSSLSGGSGNDKLTNGEIIYSEIDSPFDDNTTVSSFGNTDVTLNGGTGNDTIRIDVTSNKRDSSGKFYQRVTNPVNVVAYGGAGDDYITNVNTGVTLNGDADNDTLDTRGDNNFVIGGDGNDSVRNSYGAAVLIDLGAGDDTLTNERSNTVNSPDNVTILAGAGNDRVFDDGRQNYVALGAGDDYAIIGYLIDDMGAGTTVDGGIGNDTIFSYGSDVQITDTSGDNFISIHGKNTVNVGTGNDSINVSGMDNIINVSGGDNHIDSSYSGRLSIKSGDGDDTIELVGDDEVTVNSGAGNDLIKVGDGLNVSASNVVVYTGDGNDTIEIHGDVDYWHDHVTVDAGAGENVITTYGDSFLDVRYRISGEGSTTIESIKETHTIQIGDGTDTYAVAESGDDLIVEAGEATVTLIDAASLRDFLSIEGVEQPSQSQPAWHVDGTTVTYGTAFTINGLKPGLKVNADGEIDGIFFDGENTVYLSSSVLGTSQVVELISDGDYRLELDGDVPAPEIAESTWDFKSTIANLIESTSAGYVVADDAQSVSYIPAKTSTTATLTGIKRGTTADDLYVDEDNRTIFVGAAALGTSTLKLTKGDYSLELDYDVSTEPEAKSAWTVSSTTANLKEMSSAYYTVSGNGKSITYHAAENIGTVAAITGLAKGLKPDADGNIEGITLEEKAIIVNQNVLGNTTTRITKGNYYLVLDGVDEAQIEDVTTSISGTTANFKVVTSAGYKLSNDGKSATYTKATTQTVATATGFSKSVTEDDFYVDMDRQVILVRAAALGTGTVRLTNKNSKYHFEFEFDEDVPTEPEEKFDWSKSSTTSTLKEVLGAYYALSSDARSIKYAAAKSLGSAIATVKGVKTALNEDNIDADNTIILNGSDLNNKVTVSSASHAFEFAEDYSNATIAGSAKSDTLAAYGDNLSISGAAGNDEITTTGLNVTINGGKGNDTLYGSENGNATFLYASGDGHDVIENFTAGDTIKVTSNSKVKISSDDVDTTLTIGTGSITLTDVDNIAIVSVVDKNGKQLNADYDADYASSYWFNEDNFAQDDELTTALSSRSSRNSSLGSKVDLTTTDSATALLPKADEDELPAVAYSYAK